MSDDIKVTGYRATFTITGGTLTLDTAGITFGGSGNGSASFWAEGSDTDLNNALDAATFAPTPELIAFAG